MLSAYGCFLVIIEGERYIVHDGLHSYFPAICSIMLVHVMLSA